jgi:hypothetical protein
VRYLNEFLAFDGYEIVPHGKSYDVVDKTRGEIVIDVNLAYPSGLPDISSSVLARFSSR